MSSPPRSVDHPDRFQDAQEAIEEALLEVIDIAVRAGWGEVEALEAVRSLAEHLLLSIGGSTRLFTEIKERHPD